MVDLELSYHNDLIDLILKNHLHSLVLFERLITFSSSFSVNLSLGTLQTVAPMRSARGMLPARFSISISCFGFVSINDAGP
jgi:hypothetical protein